MLKQRLMTAAVLIPVVIWGILQLQTAILALVLGLLIVQGGWEWSGFMKLPSKVQRVFYSLVVAAGLWASWFFVRGDDWLVLPVLSIFWWLLASMWVMSYPRTVARWSGRWKQYLIGLMVLVPTWLSVISLHESGTQGPFLVLYLLTMIWVADSGAYFGGRRFGKHKLAPAVSPGKTWEGVLSALIACALYAYIASIVFGLQGNQWILFVVLSLITVIFSILGDLTESMFKRNAGIKDSGRLLPGHGGVLDRIDSITAAAPVFVVGLWLLDFESLGISSI